MTTSELSANKTLFMLSTSLECEQSANSKLDGLNVINACTSHGEQKAGVIDRFITALKDGGITLNMGAPEIQGGILPKFEPTKPT